MLNISVIIPAYNIAKYLGDALRSVIREDPPFKRIIVIDDGSTDDIRGTMSRYKDPRILFLRQSNHGLGETRNLGVSHVDSEFVYFMDGDDLLLEGFTRFISAALENALEPLDAISFSATNFRDDDGTRLDSSYFEWACPGLYNTGRAALIATLENGHLPACAFTYVVRRTALEHPSPLRFLPIIHEDEAFTPRLFLRCGPTLISNRKLYRRRIRPASITNSRKGIRNVEGYLQTASTWMDLARNAEKEEALLFDNQVKRFYVLAIRTATRAHVGRAAVQKLVQNICPQFSSNINGDYLLTSIHRGLAAHFIKRRPLDWQATVIDK